MLGNSTNIYYPKYQLDPVSAQNQPYPSPSYYPYPEPKNTYGLNPMSLTSLKNLDIDDLQDVFGKNFQDQKSNIVGTRLEKERILNEDEEINDLKNSIQRAKLNKMLAKQMYQNQMKRIQNLVNDTKAEEKVLKEIEMEHQKEKDAELKRKNDMLKAKYLIKEKIIFNNDFISYAGRFKKRI